MINKKDLGFLLTILISSSLFAQQINQQSKWTTFYNGHTINGIVTKGNSLWAGTNAGLVYINLDNEEIKLYDKTNSEIDLIQSRPHLINNKDELVFSKWGSGLLFYNYYNFWGYGPPSINTVAEDGDGGLWVGLSYGGIQKFELINNQPWGTVQLIMNNSPLPSNDIRTIKFDKNWDMWIATYQYDFNDTLTSGIIKYDGKNWTIYNKKNSPIETNQITGLVIDKDDNIWIGTEKESVYKFANNTWIKYAIKGGGGFPRSNVACMAVDSSNNIWIGTNFSGLYRYDGKDWKIYDGYNSKLRSSHIHALAVDYRGGLWVGTEIGLYRFENGDFKEYNTSNSTLPTPILKKAVKDSKGNIWCIAEDYGSPSNSIKNTNSVVKYNGTEFSYLNINDIGSGNYIINTLVVDQSDNLWIATNKGLFKYNENQITAFTQGFPIGFQAESMCADYYGNIWIGESNGSISKFDGSTLAIYPRDQYSISLDWVSTMYFDGRYIWAGEYYGDKRLMKIDPIKSGKKLINEKVDIPINQISNILLDKNGTLWVSSYYNSIARFKDSKWEIIDRSNSGIISETVSSMTIDDKQRLIFSCRNSDKAPWVSGGISILDGNKWTNYSYDKTKLGVDFISTVLTDNNGNIWAIGNSGISIMNTEEPNLNWNIVQEIENKLYQNFPNPCNPTTVIKYSISKTSRVRLKIFDILGREVKTVIDRENEKGNYFVVWDGKDNSGSTVSSGIYVYTIITNEGVQSKKLILMK